MAETKFVTRADLDKFAAGIGTEFGTRQKLLEALIQRGDLSLLQELELLAHRVAALEAGHRSAPDALTQAQQAVLKAKLKGALAAGLNDLAAQQRQGGQNGSGGTLPPLRGEAHGTVGPGATDLA